MAELKDHEQPTFPSKRKPQEIEDVSNKTPKLSTQEPNPVSNINNDLESHVALKERTINDVQLQNNDDDDDDVEDGDGDGDDDEVDVEVDRKGKSVMRDDKGKGKLIEEEDDSDDDDDDDSGESISGGESDFSDDPLAEVDLNNILPSRTRRRTAHPGLHIASDTGNAAADVDDSDDSDDSDA